MITFGQRNATTSFLSCKAGALGMRAACMQLAYGGMQAAYDGKMQAACRLHAYLVGPWLNVT